MDGFRPPPYSPHSAEQSPLRSPIRPPVSKHNPNNTLVDSPVGRPKQMDLGLSSGERLGAPPLSPVRINSYGPALAQPSSALIETLSSHDRTPSAEIQSYPVGPPMPPPKDIDQTSFRVRSPDSTIRAASSTSWSSAAPQLDYGPPAPPPHAARSERASQNLHRLPPLATPPLASSPQIIATDESGRQNPLDGSEPPNHEPEPVAQLTYFHNRGLSENSSLNEDEKRQSPQPPPRSDSLGRPMSAMMLDDRSRSQSPGLSAPKKSAMRPKSYLEQLKDPYVEPAPAAPNLNNEGLRPSVGLNASLLSSSKTFEMYKANIKKTPDQKVQYDFALFMIQAATEARLATPESAPVNADSPLSDPDNLIKEARKILEKLSGNSYPFAQYYLADGLASGAFTKNGSPDDGAAFPLFVAASKHGHAEAGYRAGLCYEYGWGCGRSGPRAEQFFRASASKGHPGSMARLSKACLTGDLGNAISEREGVRWLRRAADAADAQFNEAPYLLGRLHETGFGSDVFKDLPYAATLYTKAAELGHPDAAYRMGKAYEHSELDCPNDPPLSVHFYTLAAQQGHAEAMMGLVAWYMVGAKGFLEEDEGEAFEWAKAAAATGLPRAAYAYAYFYESGVGCRRDPLEANKWYVRAAEMGEERAKTRLRMLRDAAAGKTLSPAAAQQQQEEEDRKKDKKSRSKSRNGRLSGDGSEGEKRKKFGIF